MERKMKKILTQKELEFLRKVKTSVAFAQLILARNSQLFDYLDRLPETVEELRDWDETTDIGYKGHIGCPHCHYCDLRKQFLCEDCEWTKLAESMFYGKSMFSCCSVTFGGISHRAITYGPYIRLCYSADCEDVSGEFPDPNDEEGVSEYLDSLKACKTFVKGHVEWAEDVIERG